MNLFAPFCKTATRLLPGRLGARLAVCVALVACGVLPACKSGSGGAENEPMGTDPSTGGAPGGPGGGATGSGGGNPNSGPAGVGELIHFVGRFADDANNSKIFSWSGTQISAQFTGTGISILLDELSNVSSFGPNMYDVSIDGKTATAVAATPGGGAYALAANLAPTTHTVSVTKRTEATIGAVRFRGFVVTGGALTPKVSSVNRRLLMIGDSITCGYGVLGTTSTCHFSSATQNAGVTYGALAAAKFGADVQFASWSGKGIYRNNDGSTDTTLLNLFNLVEPVNGSTVYDWSQFVPDAIVINLGTNDFSASFGEPDQGRFTQAYLQMLATLAQAYPKAHVILVSGPMLADNYPEGTTYLTDIKAYLAAIAQAAPNGANISVLNLPTLTDAQRGCDSHPNQSAHAAMAQALEAALTAATGWQ